MKKLLYLSTLSLLLFNCDKKNPLDNETVLNILNANYSEFCRSEVKGSASTVYDQADYHIWEDTFQKLEKQGLVKFKRTKFKNGQSLLKITYTDKAKREYDAGQGFSSFKVGVTKFIPKSIVGISKSEDGNRAEIIFKGNFEPTPFFTLKSQRSKCALKSDMERKVTLVHYDTGWRME